MTATFAEWCEHYGYDRESQQAREDYERYRAEAEFAASLVGGGTVGPHTADPELLVDPDLEP